MKKDFIKKLGFTPKENFNNVFIKKYNNNYILEIDFEMNTIYFGGKILIGKNEIQNITKPEDLVVLECVNRLLEKGYNPSDVILEKVYPTGHGTSGRLDILVKKDEKSFLMIECKTRGKEFDKEFNNITKKGGQLFTYFQQDRDAEFLVLYASNIESKGKIEYKNEIVTIEDSYRETSNVTDFYIRWNKFTKQNGVFENWIKPYNFESRALTLNDLDDIKEADASFIFNRFLEILRHNTVSDKPNAFNKMFTLFLCKIYDEGTKRNDEELEFQWIEGIDDNVKFQTRLTDLYKRGMMEFLEKEITDFNDEEFNNEFGDLDENVRIKILEKITKLRLQKNNEFAIKEVFDSETFEDNAIVLKEVVELLQKYRVRYSKKQPFLGDFFELLLTTGLKQEAGQFFTPVPIARFICKSIPIEKIISNKLHNGDSTDLLPSTIDYAAGSGHFLTESMEEIQNIINKIEISNLKPNVEKEIKKWKETTFDWAGEYMYGIEKDYRLVKTAKVGCYLHGDGIATVIHGDGLDNFENSKSYRGKLKNFDSSDKTQNAKFDLVLSNPPYSVSAFKGNLKKENAEKDFGLYSKLTDNSSEIECLFIERTPQLLKEGGIAGIILPSSILSNTGIYTKAREIILRDFEIVAITELGSGTFMATGTNTVTLFLRKRNKFFAKNLEASVGKFFTNQQDVALNGIEKPVSKYVNDVWEGIKFEDYISLVQKSPNEDIKNHEIFKDYQNKIKLTKKKYEDKQKEFFEKALEIEREKLFYFILTYPQKLVLVKSGEKKEEKEFLGYEFSFRKGSEGIHAIQGGKNIDECTKLFDPENSTNPEKVNTYIYDAFNGDHNRDINESLKNHIFRTSLSDLLTFDRVDFEKTISLNLKKKVNIVSSWDIVKLNDILETLESGNRPKGGVGSYKEGIPSLGGEHIGLNGKVKLDDNIKFVPYGFFEKSEKGILNDKDILICKDGALTGKVAIFDKLKFNYKNLMINEHVFSLRVKNDIIQEYLFNYLYLPEGQDSLKSSITGQAQGGLNRENLLNIKIPLPPKVIQQKIVDEILGLEKIEETNLVNILRLKSEIEEKILNIGNDNLFKLKDLLSIVRGASPRPIREYQTNDVNGVNWIKIGDVKLGSKYLTETKEKITFEGSKKSRLVREGDFILSNSMSFGRPYIMKITGCIHDGWLLLTDFSKNLDKDYLYNILSSNLVQSQFKEVASGGTTVDNLNIVKVENVKISFPSLEIQKQIVSEIDVLEKEIEKLKEENANIPEKKKEILKKYL